MYFVLHIKIFYLSMWIEHFKSSNETFVYVGLFNNDILCSSFNADVRSSEKTKI